MRRRNASSGLGSQNKDDLFLFSRATWLAGFFRIYHDRAWRPSWSARRDCSAVWRVEMRLATGPATLYVETVLPSGRFRRGRLPVSSKCSSKTASRCLCLAKLFGCLPECALSSGCLCNDDPQSVLDDDGPGCPPIGRCCLISCVVAA